MKIYNSTISGDIISSDAGKNTISKEGFLRLLAAELQNQDPLNATDNTKYIDQMTQFTLLDQMNTFEQSMEKLLLNQKFQQGSLMIGKTAKILLDDGSTVAGLVTSVKLSNGKVNIAVDGKDYDIDDVIELCNEESVQDAV